MHSAGTMANSPINRSPRISRSSTRMALPFPCPPPVPATELFPEIDNSNHDSGGPAILHAYDATNVANERYNSTQARSFAMAGVALKLTVATIAGGNVLVGTSNESDIYGLLGY